MLILVSLKGVFGGMMPKKGYKQTKEVIENRRKFMKGRKLSEEHKKKISIALMGKNKGKMPWLFGKHLSKESRAKLSLANKGKHLSLATEYKNGHIPWSKGRKFSKEHKDKISKGNKGKIMSIESRKKMSLAQKGKKLSIETRKKISLNNARGMLGKHPSLETRKKMSLAQLKVRGRIPWNKGLTKKDDVRIKKFSDDMINGRSLFVRSYIKHGYSKKQIELFNFLKKFFPQAQLEYHFKISPEKFYRLDIAIPDLKIDFEYDGTYWHSIGDAPIRDFFRDENLIERGWCVVRVKGRKELKQILKSV